MKEGMGAPAVPVTEEKSVRSRDESGIEEAERR